MVNPFCAITSRSSVLMSRRTEEVPYHLKRAEKKQELEMTLLDIDLLILLHYRYLGILYYNSLRTSVPPILISLWLSIYVTSILQFQLLNANYSMHYHMSLLITF